MSLNVLLDFLHDCVNNNRNLLFLHFFKFKYHVLVIYFLRNLIVLLFHKF